MVRGNRNDAKFGKAHLPEIYRFALLQPAPRAPEAAAENDRVLGPRTLGIEVTVPALAARCGLGNIDPQHSERSDPRAAIEVCLDWPLPPDGSWVVTIRPDLDALGGMALLALRRAGAPLTPALRARLAEVAQADRFAYGPWPGPRLLPRSTAECLALARNPALGPAAAAAADYRVPIAQRVAIVARWLVTGDVPAQYRTAVEERAAALAGALASGALRVETVAEGRLALIEGEVDGADRIGYLRASVVVAVNPAFRFRGGTPHRKFTVCQYQPGYIDLAALARELSHREPGWGGSATIIGSPQNVGSVLPIEIVLATVLSCLPR